ncbi:MAG: hypothetical protein Q9165_002694 [Trypethelium subeluteriae]
MESTRRLEIHIEASSTVSRLAERGILFIGVSSSGTSKSTVFEDTTRVSNELQALFGPLNAKDASTGLPSANAAVTWWSMQSITTRTWIPTTYDSKTQEHKQGERQYSANTSFTVKFKDFARLNDIATDLTTQQFVTVNGVTWGLTDVTRDALACENRRNAVANAIAKARDYATAAVGEHAVVRAVDLKELQDGSETGAGRVMPQGMGGMMQMPQMLQSQTGPVPSVHGGLNFRPQDVDLQAKVKVKFSVE